MIPAFATALAGIAVKVIQNLLPNTAQDKLDLLRLQIEQEALKSDLFKSQIAVNLEEAKNPNRTWTTWRELLGYVMVVAVSWQWVVVPVISAIWLVSGHPLNTALLPQLEILDILYIMCGMLGLDAGPVIANRLRGAKK